MINNVYEDQKSTAIARSYLTIKPPYIPSLNAVREKRRERGKERVRKKNRKREKERERERDLL